MGAGTITRRMEAAFNGLEDEFKSICDIWEFEFRLQQLQNAWDKSDCPSKLKKLYELFDRCGISYERDREYSYYEKLVGDQDIPTSSENEDRVVYALFKRYEEYPGPTDYMKRLVDRLSSGEDVWENDSLRLRILKQFVKYGNYLSDAGIKGRKPIWDYVRMKTGKVKSPSVEEVLDVIDEGIFLEYEKESREAPDKEKRRAVRRKYELVKISDDLAGGKFRTEGATKKALYLFAMVYNMTFSSGGSGMPDPETDIETNLFRDYYVNNLMRFITEAYKDSLGEYETDPSGQGINYKNFAEMVYLYYISKDPDECSAADKIRLSGEMISRLKKGQAPESDVSEEKSGDTAYFRALFRNDDVDNLFEEDILELPEDEFEEFIRKHYDCNTGNRADLLAKSEQESAFREYNHILERMEELKDEEKRDEERDGIHGEERICNYGLWFADTASFRKCGLKKLTDRRPDVDPGEFEKFMDLLYAVNSFMGCVVNEEASSLTLNQEHASLSTAKVRALDVKSPRDVTRTSLIVAYYYYFNSVVEGLTDEVRGRSFEEVFNAFKAGVDKRLEGAYYQPLSGRNLFDVLVVFSSYAFINC